MSAISDILLKNGTASLKELYPLTEVKTEEDKKRLSIMGYNPGYTVSAWPYDVPVERVFYSNQLFPSTYYYDPNEGAAPIVLNLNIIGTQRLSPIDDSAFFLYIREQAAKLKNPSVEDMKSYLISLDNGFRSEVMAAYLKASTPSPELYDLFLTYYTITDYGAGAYDADTLKRVCSGRSAEQTDQLMHDLAEYPDVLTIYRGEAEGSTPHHKAISWSLDINTAYFFACRHGDGDHARIIKARARKKDIMAANLDSKEKEVILLPGVPFDIVKEKLLGLNHPAVMPDKFLDKYAEGREAVKRLYRRYGKAEKGQHDMVHSARVLFLAFEIIQAGKLKLTPKERNQLMTAIIYHDIGRDNDGVDEEHGRISREKYRGADPVVGFLIEYHCVDDRTAETALQQNEIIKAKKRAWLLYQILKDADALDRVRFGIYSLDVNFLRLPISHKLVSVAVKAVTGIKV